MWRGLCHAQELSIGYVGLVSCGMFIFYAVEVTESTDLPFTKPYFIALECVISCIFTYDYTLYFLLSDDKVQIFWGSFFLRKVFFFGAQETNLSNQEDRRRD